jgi:hypothetical protein
MARSITEACGSAKLIGLAVVNGRRLFRLYKRETD